MNRRLRWRVFVVLAVVLGSALVLFQKRLTLGLDLKGGVQFVLRVNVDEALAGNTQVTRDEIVAQARQAVDRRVNALGVVEPVIAVQGANRDQLLVQLPGFTDVSRARAVLGATARLEWRLVERGPAPSREALLVDGTEPAGMEIVPHGGSRGAEADAPAAYYLVQRSADVAGRDIRNARLTQDEHGQPAVWFSLSGEGGRRFASLTAANVGRALAIVLDGRVQSAPVINQAITGGEGIIQGGFSPDEARDLALLLRSGALPVSMTYLGGQYVGPTLGLQSIHAGIGASLGGLALVAGFMLVYYNRAGFNALCSIAANLIVLLGLMALFGAALTLPGIAGLILTIGMGVDSNVLIFERIKEELTAGRAPRTAIATGFDRVFLTILDTHVASLVAAAFLFQFGTGPIRGFATTLSLGLLSNVFTAVMVSRTLFELTTSGRRTVTLTLATFSARARRPIDFMAYRTAGLWLSGAVVGAGIAFMLVRGLPLGLDFTGGTSLVARFAAPVSEDDVRAAIPGDEIVQRYGAAPDRTLLIRIPQSSDTDMEAGVDVVKTALAKATLPTFEVAGSEMVGPSVGADLQKKGMLATVASLAGITAYIALRFRPSFAAGAMLATVHDIAVTVSMLSLCGYDLTLNVVAGVLTIAGYSVNDTIVIFDRVRENLRSSARGVSMSTAVNAAVNQTLGRTVITACTTFLAVLALYLFGGDALRGFSFAMLVGIVTGTYSTVFVAAPVAAMLARSSRRT